LVGSVIIYDNKLCLPNIRLYVWTININTFVTKPASASGEREAAEKITPLIVANMLAQVECSARTPVEQINKKLDENMGGKVF
jgi:hypothetical protein